MRDPNEKIGPERQQELERLDLARRGADPRDVRIAATFWWKLISRRRER